jgi:hypothetical protein
MSLHTDRLHEHGLAAAREATLTTAAPRLSREYGERVGRIVELAAAAAEGEFTGISHEDVLILAECIREGFWDELELPADLIDHYEVERGMCAGSQRYAEARAVEACHVR